ncbi:MAG TPA: hypothetical protein EYQ65_01070 [Cycloclasticus sp.]|nr:hypothetical protein [Cycloclasticus sp.]
MSSCIRESKATRKYIGESDSIRLKIRIKKQRAELKALIAVLLENGEVLYRYEDEFQYETLEEMPLPSEFLSSSIVNAYKKETKLCREALAARASKFGVSLEGS